MFQHSVIAQRLTRMMYVTASHINPHLYFGLADSLLTGWLSPFPDLSTVLVLVCTSAHACFCFLNHQKFLFCFVDLGFHWFNKLKQLDKGSNMCQNGGKRWARTLQQKPVVLFWPSFRLGLLFCNFRSCQASESYPFWQRQQNLFNCFTWKRQA